MGLQKKTKIAYLDCFSGISGDMCLGALVSAGVPLKHIKKELKNLPIEGYSLAEKKVKRSGIEATKIEVKVADSPPRAWKDIRRIIQKSTLSPDIKDKGLRIFKSLFEAEAKVHGESFDKIHLHELAAVDCLVDVFGTLIGIEALGIEEIYSSPLNLGSGQVKSAHGMLPVPAPVTVELLKGIPVYSAETPHELTTPTGAAIIREISSGFGNIPMMRIDKTGAGAGSRDIKDRPNILRIFIGEGKPSEPAITVIETNIDDMNPQIYEHLMDRLFKAGALDVYLTQVIMKKGRPGIKLTVLCTDDKRQKLIETVFRETTTIGVRFFRAERTVLERKIKEIDTKFGKIRVKEARFDDGVRATPEYEDCKKAAKRHNVPLIEVIRQVRKSLG